MPKGVYARAGYFGDPWTEPRVASLRQLWANGLSASEIARQLGGGVTRNAVIGKKFRLGLPGRLTKISKPPPAHWTAKRRDAEDRRLAARARKPRTWRFTAKPSKPAHFTDDPASRAAEALLGAAYAADRRRQSWTKERSYARS